MEGKSLSRCVYTYMTSGLYSGFHVKFNCEFIVSSLCIIVIPYFGIHSFSAPKYPKLGTEIEEERIDYSDYETKIYHFSLTQTRRNFLVPRKHHSNIERVSISNYPITLICRTESIRSEARLV